VPFFASEKCSTERSIPFEGGVWLSEQEASKKKREKKTKSRCLIERHDDGCSGVLIKKNVQ
jgi:hypothetical protein